MTPDIVRCKLSLETLNNVSEIDIVYKRKVNCKVSERPLVTTSQDSYEVLLHYWNGNKIELVEEFKVLMLNRANRILQIFAVSQGGMTGTVAYPRLVLGDVLKIGAVSLILSHDHPSGNLQPSRADEELTQKIKVAASYFDMTVLDHLIIISEGYYSFADMGLL